MSTSTRLISLAALVTIVIVLLIGGIIYLTSSHEPSYHGKTLSEWIVPFCRQTPKGLDAPGGPQHFEELQPTRHALSDMGTNAVPFLIAKLNYRESPLHQKVRQLLDKQPFARLQLRDPHVERVRAIRALAVLAPQARPAIPSLTAHLTDPVLAEHAVYALAGMGGEGVRVLVDQYTNSVPMARIQIAITLSSPVFRGPNANPFATSGVPGEIVIDGLTHIVEDLKSPARFSAISGLGSFGPTASNAVPILLPVLQENNEMLREMSIRALGQIKARPELVIPVLTNLLNDRNRGTQIAASSALREYGYDVPLRPYIPNALQMPVPPNIPAQPNLFRLRTQTNAPLPAPQ